MNVIQVKAWQHGLLDYREHASPRFFHFNTLIRRTEDGDTSDLDRGPYTVHSNSSPLTTVVSEKRFDMNSF